MVLGLALQMLQSLSRFPENVLFPVQELLSEILKLARIHEFLVLGRTITRLVSQYGNCLHGNSEPPRTLETRAGLIATKPVVSIDLRNPTCSAAAFGLIKLGDLDRSAQFDVVKNGFQGWIICLRALVANGASQAIQILRREFAAQQPGLDVIQSIQDPPGAADGPPTALKRTPNVLQRNQCVDTHDISRCGNRSCLARRGRFGRGQPKALATGAPRRSRARSSSDRARAGDLHIHAPKSPKANPGTGLRSQSCSMVNAGQILPIGSRAPTRR